MNPVTSPSVAIIGGGPAGLMAAEVLASAGIAADVYDAMPSLGRKFLMAGKGGLNITHAEPAADFIRRYGAAAHWLAPQVAAFGPAEIRAWMDGLGIASFVGSSGRVFPEQMKAAPLLRAWLHRLRTLGVRIHVRHRWLGWDDAGRLRLQTPEGEQTLRPSATLLALGGGSWPQLGSDAAWLPWLRARGVDIAALQPANCGFDVAWSTHFASRFAGEPVKNVRARCAGSPAPDRAGECLISAAGIEGGLVYALSAELREQLETQGEATLLLDLLPEHDAGRVLREVSHPRGARSLSSHLQSRLGIKGVKAGLLRECLDGAGFQDPARLAAAIKALPIRLLRPRPLAEAISSAGGVRLTELDPHLMLQALPGMFCAGEMLDWEAPTGGYLLTACLASGHHAGEGILAWLKAQTPAT
jgi:uncharacterized flavoprotein (TIGR03862 family)